RAPRRVTRAPIDMPSRSLNAAIDFRAFVTTGRCPVTIARSSTAESSSLPSRTASPTPMFTTIFSSRGTRMGPGSPSSCSGWGGLSCRYGSRSGAAGTASFRGRSFAMAFLELRLAALAHARLGLALELVPEPGGAAARGAHHLDVRNVDELLLEGQAAGLAP